MASRKRAKLAQPHNTFFSVIVTCASDAHAYVWRREGEGEKFASCTRKVDLRTRNSDYYYVEDVVVVCSSRGPV